MKNIKIIRLPSVLFIFLLLFCKSLIGQDKKLADDFFENNNFEQAYDLYDLLLESEPDNLLFLYRKAICILNLNQSKQEAIEILQKLVQKPESDVNSLYLLGRAYQFDYKFKEAIKCFKQFLDKKMGSESNLNLAGRQIEYCENAIELMKFPSSIKFENLGPEINSPFADYYPFVASDESFIFYNSKRNNGSEALLNGSFTADVYFSKALDGKFQKSTPVNKKINSKKFSEEVVGLSAQNNKVIIYFSEDNFSSKGQLAIVDFQNNELVKKKNLPNIINTKYSEISATINSQGNEIYFASDIPGGYGGTDLYVSRILPNGEWGPAQNLGPAINTIYDEDFPVLSLDNKVIYFSSKGHTSMGGYDIFKAEYDQEKMKFVKPRNLGFPINSPMDDMNFSVSESGKYGYLSAVREGGFGDLDIYRVTFDEIEPNYTIINGQILTENKQEIESLSMIVVDENGDLYGEYLPNLNTMRYVIILPPGNFTLTIETDNFEIYEEKMEVKDKDAFQFEIQKDITLKSKN